MGKIVGLIPQQAKPQAKEQDKKPAQKPVKKQNAEKQRGCLVCTLI